MYIQSFFDFFYLPTRAREIPQTAFSWCFCLPTYTKPHVRYVPSLYAMNYLKLHWQDQKQNVNRKRKDTVLPGESAGGNMPSCGTLSAPIGQLTQGTPTENSPVNMGESPGTNFSVNRAIQLVSSCKTGNPSFWVKLESKATPANNSQTPRPVIESFYQGDGRFFVLRLSPGVSI